jgi:hypothetical protein
MSLSSVLARGQAAAEALMVDTCAITRVGTRTTDTTTAVVTTPTTTLYTGKCRIQQAQAQAQREDIGEDHLLLLRLEVQLPMSLTGLAVGDRITITASLDGDLVGRVFRVHDLAHKTHATARRPQCLEVTGS